jgi:HEPN domain-containing protein
MSQANGRGRSHELIPDHVEQPKTQQKRPRSPLHLHPMGWFQNAISFRSAADLLFEAITSPDNKRPLRDPVYFLYHQAVELALKACLVSRGLKVPEGGKDQHDIGKLFEQCREKKLLGLDDKHFDTHNLIDLLSQGNRLQRYRYPGPNERFIPDLGWLHETVGQLFEAVEHHVAQWVAKNPSPPPPTIRATLKLFVRFPL